VTTAPTTDECVRTSVERIVAAARFTEQQQGDGTCGPCGTFALALHAVLSAKGIPSQIVAICEEDRDHVHRTIAGVDVPHWNHIAVQSHGAFFDIMGRSSPEAMILDFSGRWSRTITTREAYVLMRAAPGSWSIRRFRSYLRRLDRDGEVDDDRIRSLLSTMRDEPSGQRS
jgi:hypothetical protein